ncbi:hypothetical protein MOQ_003938 [Trypanosoma cruzi marinkellei]|uniref:Protein dpy-30 n=1 Tax=Trypanosoma cruzi marinkellei TaxID=85056 RepID=K2MAP7_TRYCR|nr:hypothetical protein MOQ_003938 [Trypanosoma cruzi marinkellei]
MEMEPSTVETLKIGMFQSQTSVLVAYADTYFGRRLFSQLYQDGNADKAGKSYKLFACTWEKDGAQVLVEERVAAALLTGAELDGAATDAADTDFAQALDSVSGAPEASLAPPPAATTTSANDHGTASLRVFWRGDTMAMLHAILQADCIVMEMRQAQDVFDMMHALSTKEHLKKKRIIVVSSLLTWYATPPIQMDPMDENGGKSNMEGDFEEKEEEEEDEIEEEEVEEEPRPPDQGEVDAILGQFDFIEGEDNENDNINDENGNETESNVELFTEDQYNRRIPHAKYYNWREAERVVAAWNSEERNIQTCVVFSGLQYGEGEDALQPFFAQAWNREKRGLPIYGDGTQIVPTVHIRDLVTFTQRLIETEEPPALPYVFATDSGTVSWQRMVNAMNRAFGGEKTFHVPSQEFALYSNVELFTLNMRVDNQTMQNLMPAEEDWVAQSGFVANISKTAFEYVKAHHLQPIRLVVLGPPLSGKTYLAEALAQRHYNLPTFTMERVLEEFKAHIAALKERLEKFRRHLYETEKKRREEAKKRAFLRKRKKAGDEEGDDENEEETLEATEEGMQPENGARNSSAADEVQGGKKKRRVAAGDKDDSDMEENPVDFTLTDEELHAVEELVEEWFQQNDRATQLRETIASMERVLAMRIRLQPAANAEALSATNPKKRKELAKSKRGARLGNKKHTTEEEDALNELQENAPFQDKALALMMRWRLSRADCRNQGYVMDGFPETVTQARLVFGDAPLDIPENMEETAAGVAFASNSSLSAVRLHEVNVAPPTKEPCEETRLPSFVFILDAAENYLLDRLKALSQKLNEPPGNEEKRLARFEEAITLYRKQFKDTDYSLSNFFECARTVAKTLTPGGRNVTVTFLKVDAEPLLSPPPPESQYSVAPPSEVEWFICERVGKPRNFGPTPQQQYREEVRELKLLEEERQKELKAAMEQCEREKNEYIRESEQRLQVENTRQEIEVMDRNSLERRKLPLREYLQHNIVPLLSKGLVEVCKTRPKDPVDFLAEWLMRHNPLDDSCFEL